MTARDVVYGRRGGRIEKWKTPAPGECRPTATVVCDCARWLVSVRDVGGRCWSCGGELVLVVEMMPVGELAPAGRAEQKTGLSLAREMLHKTA